MSRISPHFDHSNGAFCPICKTGKDTDTILVRIPGTEKDGIAQCIQMHKKCYDLMVEMTTNKETLSEQVTTAKVSAAENAVIDNLARLGLNT